MDDNAKRVRLANATASLTEWLAPLAFEALPPAQVTQLVTDQVRSWALSYGFRVAQEYHGIRTPHPKTGAERQGRIDVFGVHRSGLAVAIEIDRSSKRWSV